MRIRSDHGTKNVDVARWMLNHFGTARRPVLTSLSVHNQRSERMWVDVYRCVLDRYRNIFFYLEMHGELERDNELHLYALHFVYLPRINTALSEMVDQWNHHPLSTERNLSPLKLWTQGFYQYRDEAEDVNTVEDLLDLTETDWSYYGVDDYGPAPALQTNNNVVVPRSAMELNNIEYQRLCIGSDMR